MGGKNAAGAVDRHRYDRPRGVYGGAEGAEAKGQQAGRRHEGALGKHEQRFAFAQRRGDGAGPGDLLRKVALLDSDVSALLDGGAQQRVAAQPALRSKSEPSRQDGHHENRVEVAGVVGDPHHR